MFSPVFYLSNLRFYHENDHVTSHVTYSTTVLIMLRNVKDDKTFLSAKFQFSVIRFVKVMSNKPFFLLKAVNPGLKLLEQTDF